MVEFISLQKSIGIISIVIGIFFILINIINIGVSILLSPFILPFYLFIFIGIISYLFAESKIIKVIQICIVFISGVLSLSAVYWSGFPIILFLLSALLMLSYKFYDKNTVLKIILTFIILFSVFIIFSPEDILSERIYSACNLFAFLLTTFTVAFIIFKKSEQILLKSFSNKQIEIDEMERKLESYKKIQPDFQECINDLIRLSSEELGIIKELQSSLNGGHNGNTNRD